MGLLGTGPAARTFGSAVRALGPYPRHTPPRQADEIRPEPARTDPGRAMNETPAALGLAPDQVEDLLTTAGRAPSLHNTQPWRFRVEPDLIELHSDPDRALPVIDPSGREMRIACGAALFNLRLALHGHDIRPTVTLLPDPADPGLIATIRNGGRKPATPEQRELLRAVPRRHTNRHPFTDSPLTPADLHSLSRAALDESAWLHLVRQPDQRERLRDLVAQAHRHQMDDPTFRAELERWTGSAPGRRDGVPAAAGGPLPEPQRHWVMRDFRGASGQPAAARFEEDPTIAVLTAHLTGDRADIQVGQALERVLLAATVNGLAVSFLSQVVEVPRTREELRRLIGGSRPPQAVLRIGRGWPVSATPRRPAAELLMPERGMAPADLGSGSR
jgi:hypothetical protein